MKRPTLLLTCLLFAWSGEAEERRLVTYPNARLGAEANLTASISLADVDGDGDLDAVVANGRHWAQQNYVFLNDGHGFFRTASRLGEELAMSYRAALADFDGDGDLDVAVGNDRATKTIFENDGDGHFSLSGSFGRADVPTRNLVVADIEGDGTPDILVTNRGAPNFIYFNDGRGSFARSATFGSERDATIAVAAFDLNGDGTLELALANRDGQGNFVLLGDERVAFGTGSDETRGIAVGDMDGDGHLDLVAANIGEPNGIYYGDGAGGFPRQRLFGREDGKSYAVALADLDLDGSLDIVVANNGQPNAAYFNESLGEHRFGEAADASYGLALGDVNGDGYPDVVVANSGSANVVYFTVPAERAARNWPGFRGPNASGLADGLDLPEKWDGESSAHVEWKTRIPGLGHSSPIFWDDRIFLTTAVSDNADSIFVHGLDGRIDRRTDLSRHSFRVYCLDRRSGAVLWEREASSGVPAIQRHRKNSYASSTPTTDGERVIAYFGSEGLYAYDFEGALLWKQDLGTVDAGASYDDTYDWGPASSPVIYQNLVILLVDQQQGRSFMAAFDVETGEPVWRIGRDVISSFSTPALFEGPDGVELVTNGAEWMHGYDPHTGVELWRLFGSSKNTTPTPVVSGDRVYITSGYRIKPIFALRQGGEVAWSTESGGSYMTTPIVYRDYLYTCQNNGVLSCYRASSGERVYQKRVASGAFSASPIASDGKLYITSEDGDIYVVRAGPEYQLLQTNRMGEVTMATPAAAEGQLLIRTQHHLFSIRDERP